MWKFWNCKALKNLNNISLIKKTDAKKSVLSEKAALHHRTCLGDKKIFISTFRSCLTLSALTDGIYTASHLITKMECEDENALKSFPQGHHIYKLSLQFSSWNVQDQS